MNWEPERLAFRQWVRGLNPQLSDFEADRLARTELFHMLAEEEERITQEDPDHKLTAEEVSAQATRNLQRRLKLVTKPNVNQNHDFGESELFYQANVGLTPDPGSYGTYLASHLKPLAAISTKANDLLSAARADVENNRGRGHHWRKELLSLGIPGVGPKEASYAWMLLQPQTSQLAVIDPHMMQVLGHKPEDISPRDYFKYERELAAGRDASGYHHVPLGSFGWGLWDYARLGHGEHDDHRPLRALDPQPHDQVDWLARDKPMAEHWQAPYWWDATQDARDQVGQEFDRTLGLQGPKHLVPFEKAAKTADALSQPSPWFRHHETGEEDVGAPGESIMQFIKMNTGLSTEDIWALNHEAGKVGP